MSESKRTGQELLYSCCVIADVQYADKDDGLDFRKVRERRYRTAFDALSHCINDCINGDRKGKIPCLMQLGDLLDGYSSSKGREYSMIILKKLLNEFTVLNKENIEVHHIMGNHELYNFSRVELQKLIPCYHHFSPISGWRFICLDGFLHSMLGLSDKDAKGSNKSDPDVDESEIKKSETGTNDVSVPSNASGDDSSNGNEKTLDEKYEEMRKKAREFLKSKNPNDIDKHGVNWKDGLHGVDQRFVPYNGGLGDEQTRWLKEVLHNAKADNEKVIIFSHLPVYPGSANDDGLAWDCFEVIDVIRSVGKDVVVAFLAGHDHPGGYAFDESTGTHYCTLESPLGCDSKLNKTVGIIESHGFLDFYGEDIENGKKQKITSSASKDHKASRPIITRVELNGKGLMQSRVLFDITLDE